MEPGDRFLMGVDLRKDVARIEAAYNDRRGVTAEFNRNMLRVLNHELGADFDPAAFDHLAFYEPVAHRIEMHLVSRRPQMVTVPGIGVVSFDAGESLRTEISCKHDRESVAAALRGRGPRDRGLAQRSRLPVRAGRGGAGVTSAHRAVLEADLAEHVFRAPPTASLTPRRVGAEVELIPVEAATGRRCPLEADGSPSMLPFLRRYGGAAGLERDLAPPRARRASSCRPAGP